MSFLVETFNRFSAEDAPRIRQTPMVDAPSGLQQETAEDAGTSYSPYTNHTITAANVGQEHQEDHLEGAGYLAPQSGSDIYQERQRKKKEEAEEFAADLNQAQAQKILEEIRLGGITVDREGMLAVTSRYLDDEEYAEDLFEKMAAARPDLKLTKRDVDEFMLMSHLRLTEPDNPVAQEYFERMEQEEPEKLRGMVEESTKTEEYQKSAESKYEANADGQPNQEIVVELDEDVAPSVNSSTPSGFSF